MSNEQALAQPTLIMLEFFHARTQEHIGRVARGLRLLAQDEAASAELIERAVVHDRSKFEDPEYIPYVWLTEFHRCRQNGLNFRYPAGMEVQVRHAIRHHLTTNRHHPEFHADPNAMSHCDLLEMVCDWSAMAQEFKQDGGSARGWAMQTVGRKFKFDAVRSEIIFESIARLDAALKEERDD